MAKYLDVLPDDVALVKVSSVTGSCYFREIINGDFKLIAE